jgi:hypothetical protein
VLSRRVAVALVVAGGLAVVPSVCHAADVAPIPAPQADTAAQPAPDAQQAEADALVARERAACAARGETLVDESPAATAPAVPAVTPAPAPTDAVAAGKPPVAHCSQNAGDEQYKDPFAHTPPPTKSGAGSAQTPQPTSAGTAAGAAPTNVDGTVVAGAAQTDAGTADGPGLPNTGLGLGGLLALGLPLLGAGFVLRRRLT